MVWKKIKTTNNLYECSRCGKIKRVRSVVNFGKNKRLLGVSILKPKTKANGYQEVNLYIEPHQGKSFYVHRLIAETWIGEIPPKMTVNHKDGDKKNNHVDNLEIVTYSENSIHAYNNGLNKLKPMPGEMHPRSKTNDREVAQIRSDHNIHRSINKLVANYPHLSRGTLTKIVYKQTWKHVP